MARLVLLMMVSGVGPVLAHPGSAIHLHHADYVSLVLGAVLIVTGMVAAVFVRGRAR